MVKFSINFEYRRIFDTYICEILQRADPTNEIRKQILHVFHLTTSYEELCKYFVATLYFRGHITNVKMDYGRDRKQLFDRRHLNKMYVKNTCGKYSLHFKLFKTLHIQLTLAISNSLISNNRLSRREKSGPCLNMKI